MLVRYPKSLEVVVLQTKDRGTKMFSGRREFVQSLVLGKQDSGVFNYPLVSPVNVHMPASHQVPGVHYSVVLIVGFGYWVPHLLVNQAIPCMYHC